MNTPMVRIEILPGGTRCIVQGVEIDCKDVAVHLREELKLAPGHLVAVNADLSVGFEHIAAVFDSTKAAGFTHRTAYVLPPNNSLERTRDK